MKLGNPFKSNHHVDPEMENDLHLEEIESETRLTEAAKEAKRAEREQKRLERELAQKRKQQEKLVAPILLLLTVLISAVLWLFRAK